MCTPPAARRGGAPRPSIAATAAGAEAHSGLASGTADTRIEPCSSGSTSAGGLSEMQSQRSVYAHDIVFQQSRPCSDLRLEFNLI